MTLQVTRADIVDTITPADVRGWFELHNKPWPSNAVYVEIADQLSRMRWGDDPPPVPPPYLIDPDPVEWWDFEGTAAAANELRDAIPLMLSYWDRVRRKREKCEGVATMGDRYDAVKALDGALTAAMPYFNPFGSCEASYRKQPKAWHMPAILIADIITKAMVASGYDPPSLERKS